MCAQPTLRQDPKSVTGKGDTVIGAAHQQAIVTLVEHKSGYAVLAKIKTQDVGFSQQRHHGQTKALGSARETPDF